LRILNSVGVEYSHANETLLRPTHVEGKVTEHAIKKHRQRKAEAAKRKGKKEREEEEEEEPPAQWPPVRKKTGIASKVRLQARKEALLALGYVSSWSEIDKFAAEFNLKTSGQQQEIMGKLDDWSSLTHSRQMADHE